MRSLFSSTRVLNPPCSSVLKNVQKESLMKSYSFDGIQVDIGTPVEVGRQSGHFWFSSVHRFSEEELLCEVVAAPDEAQGKWPAVLFSSRDQGASWTRSLDIDSYGPASVLLEPGRLLLMPYEVWPLTADNRRNGVADGTLLTRRSDGSMQAETTPVRFLNFPFDLAEYHEKELSLLTNGNILRLDSGRLLTTAYGHLEGDKKYSAFALTSEDGGLTWRFLSVVASWRDIPDAPEGPDESNTVLLADGRLMCVYRVGSGRDHLYHRSYSGDDGRSWSAPEPVNGAWSVEPGLTRLDNGLLLLSGGRTGLFLWLCPDGVGERWTPINLAEHHNACLTDASLHFSKAFCSAREWYDPYESTSYTEILRIGPDEALICYDRLGNGWGGAPGPYGATDMVFCIRVRARRES
jgi:hypothetical protein